MYEPIKLTTNLKPVFSSYNKILGGNANTLRPSQLQFIITCQEGVANRLPVVIEGPTGLGKTKALLTVASAYLAENENAKVLYTTRTMPQLENVVNDLKEICSGNRGVISMENRLFAFSTFIGTTSLRRVICSKQFPDLIFDEDEMEKFRLGLPDPEKPNPCPDCPLTEKRSCMDENNSILKQLQFGHRELLELVRSGECPNSYMQYASRNSSIIVTTYPYLFDDHWKAVYLGDQSIRAQCLPILDEAHNIIDNICDQPALSLHLTKELDQGKGMNLSQNSYYFTYLLDRIRYGYRDVIIGPVSVYYENIANSENEQLAINFEKISDLNAEIEKLTDEHEHAKKTKEEFNHILSRIRIGDTAEINLLAKFTIEISKSAKLFNKANQLIKTRDNITREIVEKNESLSILIDDNKERQERTIQLKQQRDSIPGGINITLDGRDREKLHNRIQVIANNWQITKVQIKEIGEEIKELKAERKRMNIDQKEAYSEAKSKMDSIFSMLMNKINSTYEKKKTLIESNRNLKQEVSSIQARVRDLNKEWKEIQKSNLENEEITDLLNDFFKKYKIDPENLTGFKNELDKGFNIFRYLESFRESLAKFLETIKPGPVDGSILNDVLNQLNESLLTLEGKDLFQFLEITEDAIELFEERSLKSKKYWEGKALYAFRQLFRTLALIIHGPYGFAGHISYENNYPVITFSSLDPAVRFKDAYHDLLPPVLASATISPVKDVAKVLGLGNAIRAKIEPAFPVDNYLSFAFLGVNSSRTDPDKVDIFNEIETNILKNNIREILNSSRRHTGLFCASHNVLTEVTKIIDKKEVNSCGMKLLIARSDKVKVEDDFNSLKDQCEEELFKGLGDFDSRLKVFMELAGKVPIVLAGVSGGGLAEGVDFRGNLMEMAIIIGLPYQDEGDRKWINEKRTGFYKMKEGSLETGKDLAYRQSALRKTAQTAGRIHRTLSDKGVIVFFDERLLGIKNNAASGSSRYEILNTRNTGKHWDILQKRILESLEIVSPPEIIVRDSDDLYQHVKKVFRDKIHKPGLIYADQCFDKIKNFYN